MNETTPRISIVMPSFNQAEFLTAAVLSVLESAADDVELVVADGASTDGTQALLADLALRFPGRLRWQSAPDGGPAAAINDAVRRARAPLLGWLNSDDLYAPGAITRALAHFATHPDDVMAYGQATHVDIAGQHL
jgi:glycosyltransferase involved in cell wall biosynthesis